MAAMVKSLRHFQISGVVLSLKSNASRCLMSTKVPDETETNRHKENDPEHLANKDKQNEDAIEEKNKLASTVQKLVDELKASEEKYALSVTELDNVKTRLMKQVEDAALFGIQGFSKDLLEVVDILSTAINSVPPEELQASNPHLMNLFEGLNTTNSELIQVLKKYGVEPVATNQGDKFNPNCHEALFQVPIDSRETQIAETVARVQKIGYRLHNRTLRPALVGVFKTP